MPSKHFLQSASRHNTNGSNAPPQQAEAVPFPMTCPSDHCLTPHIPNARTSCSLLRALYKSLLLDSSLHASQHFRTSAHANAHAKDPAQVSMPHALHAQTHTHMHKQDAFTRAHACTHTRIHTHPHAGGQHDRGCRGAHAGVPVRACITTPTRTCCVW